MYQDPRLFKEASYLCYNNHPEGDQYYFHFKKIYDRLFGTNYINGDKWNRQPLKEAKIHKNEINRVAKVNNGSGFYLGRFNDKHIVATNNHVWEESNSCEKTTITFTSLNLKVPCKKLLHRWPEIDLALITIDYYPSIDQLGTVTFSKIEPYQDLPLLTIGRGSYKNDEDKLKVEQSEDCRILLDYSKLKKRKGVWTLPVGCDISAGDSGSPVYHLQTGELIGIVWGAMGRNFGYSSSEIRELQQDPHFHNLLRQESSYIVPFYQFLSTIIEQKLLDQ